MRTVSQAVRCLVRELRLHLADEVQAQNPAAFEGS